MRNLQGLNRLRHDELIRLHRSDGSRSLVARMPLPQMGAMRRRLPKKDLRTDPLPHSRTLRLAGVEETQRGQLGDSGEEYPYMELSHLCPPQGLGKHDLRAGLLLQADSATLFFPVVSNQ